MLRKPRDLALWPWYLYMMSFFDTQPRRTQPNINSTGHVQQASQNRPLIAVLTKAIEQLQDIRIAEGSDPVDTIGLCLLSLDSGGVRGLSTLYILKNIFTQLNHGRSLINLPPVKPCEVFNLIGSTSTGGYVLIAYSSPTN